MIIEKTAKIGEVTAEEWHEYRAVQDSGMFNMYDPRAREMTDVSRNKWISIMKHYSKLKEKFEGVEDE